MIVSEDFVIENFLLKDARCNQSVVSGIKYIDHLNDTFKYIECVSVGLGIEQTCTMGSIFKMTWMNCVYEKTPIKNDSTVVVFTNVTKDSTPKLVRNLPQKIFTIN